MIPDPQVFLNYVFSFSAVWLNVAVDFENRNRGTKASRHAQKDEKRAVRDVSGIRSD